METEERDRIAYEFYKQKNRSLIGFVSFRNFKNMKFFRPYIDMANNEIRKRKIKNIIDGKYTRQQ